MKQHITQNDAVLSHLKQYSGITSKEAFEKYGITRLSSIIYRLRKAGYIIESRSETTKTRLGGQSTYDRYYLISPQEGT